MSAGPRKKGLIVNPFLAAKLKKRLHAAALAVIATLGRQAAVPARRAGISLRRGRALPKIEGNSIH